MSQLRIFVGRRTPEAGLKLIREAAQAEIWPGEPAPPREVPLEKARVTG